MIDYEEFFDGHIYSSFESVPADLRPFIAERTKNGVRNYDYLSMLRRGLSWAIEPFEHLQPESFTALTRAGPLMVCIQKGPQYFAEEPPLAAVFMAFESGGRMIELTPAFSGLT